MRFFFCLALILGIGKGEEDLRGGLAAPPPALDAREEDTNADEAEERDKHAKDERLVTH